MSKRGGVTTPNKGSGPSGLPSWLGGFWVKHGVMAAFGFILYLYFFEARSNWSPDMARWKAVGDAAFILLWATMMIGPLVKIIPRTKILNLWRRPISIWAGLLMLLHGYLVLDGWARWTMDGLLGYSTLPNVEGVVLLDPGFGLANVMGLVALAMAMVLLAISSDWALNYLGAGSWKRLQGLSRTIYALVSIHVFYFVAMHYDLSLKSLVFQKPVPDPNPFAPLFFLLIVIQLGLSAGAFMVTVNRNR